MNARILTLCVVATIVSFATPNAKAYDPRIWVDATGEFSVVGAFDPERSYANGSDSVVIVDKRGRSYQCSVGNLSETDNEYLEIAKKVMAGDAAAEEELDWILDSAREQGVRRVVEVDGVEYAFRWVPPGKYSEPTDVLDPNIPRSVAANYSSAKAKKTAPKKFVKTGFWMLETEVTLEMFNQFATETK